MRHLLWLIVLGASLARAQVGSVASTCIWSGTVADCLPSAGLLLRNQRDLRLGEATASGANYVAIQAPTTLAADVTLTLPADDGDADEVLGTNGSGTLDWTFINNANVGASAAIAGSKIVAATGAVSGVVTTSSQTFAGLKDFTTNGITAPTSALGNVHSGTYTPTLTVGVNVAAATPYVTGYMRVGNVVTVAGSMDVDPTLAAANASEVGISLPVASNFSAIQQCGGSGSSGDQVAVTAETMRIWADAGNDRATMGWLSNATANHTISFIFTYIVL